MRDQGSWAPELYEYMVYPIGPVSDHDGGPADLFHRHAAGVHPVECQFGLLDADPARVAADVALLALAGRPNVNGEPFQGSMAEFIVRRVEMLRPKKVVFCHHDAFLPPYMNGMNVDAAAEALRTRTPWTELVTMTYGDPVALFA